MRIIDVIENYYNCKIIHVKANLRGGEKYLYQSKQTLGNLVFNIYDILIIDIDGTALEVSYHSSRIIDYDQNFLIEMLGCLLESNEPWSLHEALSIVAGISSDKTVSIDALLSQTLNTLLCSHLFDKAAILFFNGIKKELRGIEIASIPPYDKSVTEEFRNLRIPISNLFVSKLLEDSSAHLVDKDLIFEKFDKMVLKNNLIFSPIVMLNRVYGVLITYSDNPYEDKHIYATKSTSKFIQALISASIVFRKYQQSIMVEKELRKSLETATDLATLGNYAATVAHEIKNPLISIGGFAKRLLKAVNDPNIQKMANIISSESERLERLTYDILSFSKKHSPKKVPVRLYDELLAIQMLFESRCSESAILLNIDKSTDVEIQVDKNQIRQVILNLIVNAMNAIDNNGTVDIKCNDEGSTFSIAISDTGSGIPIEHLDNLFTPFFTTSSNGTGLGLAISKKIMINHGGDIRVANLKSGAEFTLIIPK